MQQILARVWEEHEPRSSGGRIKSGWAVTRGEEGEMDARCSLCIAESVLCVEGAVLERDRACRDDRFHD